jgi:hypothetical protein
MIENYRQPKQKHLLSDIELLERDDSGYELYKLDAGVYQAEFAFRNFGENEQDWFSRASDRQSDWQSPFIFDYEHPEVKKFEISLFKDTQNMSNVELIKVLSTRLGTFIRSMDINEPEFNNSLSDIVTSGRGMCDAKSVLFGSMLARNTTLTAQAITGQFGQVKDKVTYPFSHQWMRIADGDNIFLFDPMYEKLATFEQEEDTYYAMDEQDGHFSNLTPACYPAGKLITKMDIQSWGGVRAVPSYLGDNHEIYVENEDSLACQLSNAIPFVFELDDEKELELHNGALKTGTADTALYFPVKSFSKKE